MPEPTSSSSCEWSTTCTASTHGDAARGARRRPHRRAHSADEFRGRCSSFGRSGSAAAHRRGDGRRRRSDPGNREAGERELQAFPGAMARDAARRVRARRWPLAARARGAPRREPVPRDVLRDHRGQRRSSVSSSSVLRLPACARADRPRRDRHRRDPGRARRSARAPSGSAPSRQSPRWNALEQQLAGLLDQRRRCRTNLRPPRPRSWASSARPPGEAQPGRFGNLSFDEAAELLDLSAEHRTAAREGGGRPIFAASRRPSSRGPNRAPQRRCSPARQGPGGRAGRRRASRADLDLPSRRERRCARPCGDSRGPRRSQKA